MRVGAGHGCLEGAGDELDGFSFQELAPISRAPRNVKVKDESAKLNFIVSHRESLRNGLNALTYSVTALGSIRLQTSILAPLAYFPELP